MAFKLEHIRKENRTFWRGAIDQETGDFLTLSFKPYTDPYIEFELRYKGEVITIEVDEDSKPVEREGDNFMPTCKIYIVKRIGIVKCV